MFETENVFRIRSDNTTTDEEMVAGSVCEILSMNSSKDENGRIEKHDNYDVFLVNIVPGTV